MKEKKDIWTELQNPPSKAPFKVPEGYFDSLEDRIEARIAKETEQVSSQGKLIRMLKPVLAMAASFALIFMLVYYPLSVFLPSYLAKTSQESVEKPNTLSEDELLFSYFSASTNSLYDLFGDEEEVQEEVDAEELLDYLSTEMNETEIFASLNN
ncbi:hypothetical protein [uncultured Sunxiuqinia sp.]|uniref:hypothetical protein n=1 Tax=uncultured Sunxiuqinia sp. TaxID=1573825 RepID=UPI002619E97E|nr:hypothetical protein [uncultured Sunxiuqinia sp.]